MTKTGQFLRHSHLLRHTYMGNDAAFLRWHRWFITAIFYFAIYRFFVENQTFSLNQCKNTNVLNWYCNLWVNFNIYAFENPIIVFKTF